MVMLFEYVEEVMQNGYVFHLLVLGTIMMIFKVSAYSIM